MLGTRHGGEQGKPGKELRALGADRSGTNNVFPSPQVLQLFQYCQLWSERSLGKPQLGDEADLDLVAKEGSLLQGIFQHQQPV